MTTAQDGGKVVSLTQAAFTPRKYSRYSFLLEAETTPGPQCDRKDFMSMKNPWTPAGIEPATFRFVAQHLNQCPTAVTTNGGTPLFNDTKSSYGLVGLSH